jgi:peptide/nickel transport system permease protein
VRRYAVRRSVLAVAQCFFALLVVFALDSLVPGDTADVLLGDHGNPQQAAALRAKLGLDEPVWQRFWDWLGSLLAGDPGRSLVTGVPVGDELAGRLAVSVVLALPALALVAVLAPLLGVATGLREGTRLDRALNTATVLLHSVPEFVLGMLLIAALSVAAGLLPATAAGLDAVGLLGQPGVLVMPVLVLAARQLCDLARQIRVGTAEQLRSAPAEHLRLLGLPERRVVLRHVLPNALAPATQQFARCVEGLLGGALVVESLFSVQGVGTGFVQAVQNRDTPQVQSYALLFAGTVVVVNLAGDLLSQRLAPRREVWA